jgi:prepilin peptidase CpaA
LDWFVHFTPVFEIVLLLYVAAADLAVRVIPNVVCWTIVVLGLTSRLLAGPIQVAESLAVAAILLLLLLPLHGRGWIGGGDVKLLVALAAGLPFVGLMHLLTIMALAGGVLAMAYLLLRLLPQPSPAPAGSSLLRRVYAIERWRGARRAPLPYGVAIACGGIWVLLSRGD